MPIYSTTRLELRHSVSRLPCKDLRLATVSSPGSGTFVDTSFRERDDYFNQWTMYVYEGTNVGYEAVITDWVQSTSTFTFEPGTTLATDDKVELHQVWTVEEYNEAINEAISQIKDESLEKTVSLVTPVDGQLQYAIPTDFRWVTRIDIEDSNGEYESTISNRNWQVLVESTPKIELLKIDEPDTAKKMRVIGFEEATPLSSDTESTSISPEYIRFQAAALLFSSRIRGGDLNYDEFQNRYKIAQERADRERGRTRAIPGGWKVY